jgi:hypothetical protein
MHWVGKHTHLQSNKKYAQYCCNNWKNVAPFVHNNIRWLCMGFQTTFHIIPMLFAKWSIWPWSSQEWTTFNESPHVRRSCQTCGNHCQLHLKVLIHNTNFACVNDMHVHQLPFVFFFFQIFYVATFAIMHK